MPTAFVQSGSAVGTTSATVTLGAAVTSRNSLTVLWQASNAADTGTVSDNGSPAATWNAVDSLIDTPNGDAYGSSYAQNVTGAPTTITVTVGTGHSVRVLVHEIGGAATSGGLDGHAANLQTNPGTATDAVTVGPITTTVNGAYIFVGTYDGVSFNQTITPGTGFTGRLNPGLGGAAQRTEDLVQTNAGAITGTFTQSASASNTVMASFIMAFPPVSADTLWAQSIF